MIIYPHSLLRVFLRLAQKIECYMYLFATTKEEYMNTRTLFHRVKKLAQDIV